MAHEVVVERSEARRAARSPFALLFALSPLAALGLEMLGVRTSFWPVSVAFGVVVITLGVLDARWLRRMGFQGVIVWWVLLPVVYLVHRSRRTGSSVALPILWVATTLAAFFFIQANAVEEPEKVFNAEVEPAIEQMYTREGDPGVEVSCPLMHGYPGDVFFCEASTPSKAWTVEVEFGIDGAWIWREHG